MVGRLALTALESQAHVQPQKRDYFPLPLLTDRILKAGQRPPITSVLETQRQEGLHVHRLVYPHHQATGSVKNPISKN